MASALTYAWQPGARKPMPAQVAGEEISRIRSLRGKMFKPVDVVQASVAEDAPLHPAFEWNDDKAAAAHRISQARHLIGCITVINQTQPEQAPIRAFVSVTDDEGEHQYTTVAYAMSQQTLREQVLRAAERDMQAFERKYHSFMDLAEVIASFQVAQVRAAELPEARAS